MRSEISLKIPWDNKCLNLGGVLICHIHLAIGGISKRSITPSLKNELHGMTTETLSTYNVCTMSV